MENKYQPTIKVQTMKCETCKWWNKEDYIAWKKDGRPVQNVGVCYALPMTGGGEYSYSGFTHKNAKCSFWTSPVTYNYGNSRHK